MNTRQYATLSFLSFSLVAVAVALQVYGYQGVSFMPCPLCVLQRIGYLGIAFSCLLAIGIKPWRKAFHLFATLFAYFGVAVAGHHVWLLSHPSSSCGIDPLEVFVNKFSLAQAIPWLFKADGFCSAKLPTIIGLEVPEWSFVWFLLFAVLLSATLFKKRL